jgi:hypothetical protein
VKEEFERNKNKFTRYQLECPQSISPRKIREFDYSNKIAGDQHIKFIIVADTMYAVKDWKQTRSLSTSSR